MEESRAGGVRKGYRKPTQTARIARFDSSYLSTSEIGGVHSTFIIL